MLNKKHVLATTVASLVIATSASASGVYVGGQLGWGTTHQPGYSSSDVNNTLAGTALSYSFTNKNTNSGLAGRIFAGYDITENFAAELGWTKFSDSTAKLSGNIAGIGFSQNQTVKTYAVDLVGKATMPLQDGFSVYGKLGAAYLSESGSASATILSKSVASQNHTESKIYPTFGAGVGYEITKGLVTDVSWNRIQKVGNNSYLRSTDLVGLGLTYHFG